MNTYKVIVSQVIWYETFIQADSEEEVEEIISEDDGRIEIIDECGNNSMFAFGDKKITFLKISI